MTRQRTRGGGGRRILLAWEMGEGYGHAARLLTIAQGLRDDGWDPVVAARDPKALAERYAQAGIALIAAPAHTSCFDGPGRFRAASYADIMGVCGYAAPARLAAVTAAWDAILARQAPAAIIADYSPLLSLAAFGRLPLIAVGDGFVTPHSLPGGHFVPFDAPDAQPVWDPAHLLSAAHAVQRARGEALPASLAQIVEGSGQVVCVTRELDIYGTTRPLPAAGPWDTPGPPLRPPHAPAVFAYLRLRHPLSRLVLQALIECQVRGECYLTDADSAMVASLERTGIKVHGTPPPLREALARTSFLIHHGGIGSMETAALAGRPQLVLPRHMEHMLNARRAMASLPAIFTVHPAIGSEQLRLHLARLLHDANVLRAAQTAAVPMAGRQPGAWDALRRLLPR